MAATNGRSAKGRRAKTDRLDAAVIAEFTATMADLVPVPPDTGRETLAGLLRARRLVVDKRADLTKAMKSAPEVARPALRHAIAHMASAIETLEGVLAAHQAADAALTGRIEALLSAPGLGPVVALTLAVRVPELGHTSANRIAALLGVAPFDQDSGDHHGVRRIAGGRAEARPALDLATLSAATRRTGVLATFDAQLLARGKPPKVALTACMGQLIVRLKARLAHQQMWQEHPA